MRYVFDRRLPLAPLIRIYRSPGAPMFSAFRLGNHWSIYVWRLNVVVREPWLADYVRQLYPQVLRDHDLKSSQHPSSS